MEHVDAFLAALEVFRQLRFEFIKVVENYGRDSAEVKQEYDAFVEVKNRLISDHAKISTNDLPLKIGIVGNFSTGKSLLINSLIGTELLGVADVPATCKVTILSYRNVAAPQIYKISLHNKAVEVSYEEYLKYSMHHELQDHEENIYFEIYHPAVSLKDFQIVDTPGFSSLSTRDDQITREYLDKADLLLWVFDASKGAIDETEWKLLKSVSEKRIIAVINKIDDVPPGDRQRVIASFTNAFDFFSATPYSALYSLEYQKNCLFNNLAFQQVTEKLMELMAAHTGLNFVRAQNSISIIANGNTLFEASLKEVNEVDEEIQYHFSLVNILKKIRQEVTVLKNEMFVQELSRFHDEEKEIWLKLLADTEETAAEQMTEFEAFIENLSVLKEKLTLRIEKHYEVLQSGLVDKLFDKLYRYYYKEAGWLEPAKDFLLKQDINDEFESVIKTLRSAFDTFLNRSIEDLENGLKSVETDVEDNYEIQIIEALHANFYIASLSSIVGCYHISEGFELKIPRHKCSDIMKQNLSRLISAEQFKNLTIAFVTEIIGRVFRKREVNHKREQAVLADFINTIKLAIHG
jgi:GTPase SAR1 family protein